MILFSSKISMILSFALEGFLEPHLEQNKSPSSIKWPHWVQYTIFFVTRALDKPWKADFWDDSNSEKMKKRFWKKSKYCEKQKKKSAKKEKSREKKKKVSKKTKKVEEKRKKVEKKTKFDCSFSASVGGRH